MTFQGGRFSLDRGVSACLQALEAGQRGSARLTRGLAVRLPHRIWLFALSLLLAVPLAAQALAMRHFDRRDGLPQSQVTALLEDRNGFIWAGTNEGVTRLGPNGYQLFDATTGLRSKDIVCLLEDRAGAIWAASAERGVARIRGREVTTFGLKDGLPDETTRALLETRRGDLLVGTGQGLVRRQGERFERIPLPEPWGLAPIQALAEDAEGWVWLGARKGTVARWKEGAFEVAELPAPAEMSPLISIRADPSGQVWILESERVMRRSRDGHWQVEALPGLPSSAVFTAFTFTPEGELLLSLGSDGLYLRRADGSHRLLNRQNLLCRDSINCALRDRNGGLWIGTDGDYLWVQALPGLWSLTHDTETDLSLGLGSVTSFLALPGNRILFGSNNGVILWQQGKGVQRRWLRRDGLASEDVWMLKEDGAGGAWVGTLNGLGHLGSDGRIRPGPPELKKSHIQCMVRQGNRLWVGTDMGLVELDLRGRFLGRHHPVPVRCEAQLDALGGSWQALESGNGSIQFGGLSPGTHLLRFRTSLDGTVWNEAAPVRLTIKPTWYQTLWARLILMAVLAFACILVIQARFRTLERNNEALEAKVRSRTKELQAWTRELALRNQGMEWTQRQLKDTLESRMQMINTVSHDLRSPLTSILLSVERINGGGAEVEPGLARVLGIMKHEAHRLDAILKGLLDKNRAESLTDRLSLKLTHPQDLLENLETTLQLKAEARGLQTRLDLDADLGKTWVLLDSVAMRQVLFNLVENALKFTEPPGAVGVRTHLKENHWHLEVWDTGRGIPRAECERLFHPFEQGQHQDAKKGWGLGLYICRTIVEAHGGRIEVESEVGSGSVFRVSLPLVGSEIPA